MYVDSLYLLHNSFTYVPILHAYIYAHILKIFRLLFSTQKIWQKSLFAVLFHEWKEWKNTYANQLFESIFHELNEWKKEKTNVILEIFYIIKKYTFTVVGSLEGQLIGAQLIELY